MMKKFENGHSKTAEKNNKEKTSFANFCIIIAPMTLPCNPNLSNKKYQHKQQKAIKSAQCAWYLAIKRLKVRISKQHYTKEQKTFEKRIVDYSVQKQNMI